MGACQVPELMGFAHVGAYRQTNIGTVDRYTQGHTILQKQFLKFIVKAVNM